LTFGAAHRRCAQRVAEKIHQLVLVVVKFIDIELVLAHQFDGQRKCGGGVGIIVEVNLAMGGTRF
jgi:hypothetical protein